VSETQDPCPSCGRTCRCNGGKVEGAPVRAAWAANPRSAAEERADLVAYLAHAAAFPEPTLPVAAYLRLLGDLVTNGAHEGWATKRSKP